MEKDNFLEKLKKLVEVAKTKHNALDVTEINDFFVGDDLSPEQMEQIYNYLEQKRIDVVPVIDDNLLAEEPLLLDDDDIDMDDSFLKDGEDIELDASRSSGRYWHRGSGSDVFKGDRYGSAVERR